MEKTLTHSAPSQSSSLDQMAEEIFSLTVMSWRERLGTRGTGAATELSEAQYLAIDTLIRANAPLTVGQIQRSIGVLPAQMSRIMRSLETTFSKPLVRCELNQSDKRKIDVRLTAEGARIYEEFRRSRLAKTVDILSQLAEKERVEFVRICRRIRELYATPKTANAASERENSTP
jgi:DNA-binding MarR family transcriptional regulator